VNGSSKQAGGKNMVDLLSKYGITTKVFSYFRIKRTDIEKFLSELETEGFSKKNISIAFTQLDSMYKGKYPIYWKKIFKNILESLKTI
jgi:hypothetical protein